MSLQCYSVLADPQRLLQLHTQPKAKRDEIVGALIAPNPNSQ